MVFVVFKKPQAAKYKKQKYFHFLIKQFYPDAYNNRKGSMASFSFRLLIAKLPLYLGSPKVALDRLTDMLFIAKDIQVFYAAQPNEKAEQFWIKREQTILHTLINCTLTVK